MFKTLNVEVREYFDQFGHQLACWMSIIPVVPSPVLRTLVVEYQGTVIMLSVFAFCSYREKLSTDERGALRNHIK